MTGIPSYSTTPSENVQANTGINWDEGMPPASVNNSARQNMTDMRLQWNDASWFQYGTGSKNAVEPVYASGTSFAIAGVDVTAYWHVGRRVKAVGSGTGTIYGTISNSTFSTNTTVTVVWDSGSLSNETLTIYASTIQYTGYPVAGMRPATSQLLTSGSGATYTTPANCRQIKVTIKGGGGGGSGTGSTGPNNGGTGGTTTFNSIDAAGGSGGTDSQGGAGGSGGSGSATYRRVGAPGGNTSLFAVSGTNSRGCGGNGGGQGAGRGGLDAAAGGGGQTNSGAGGGGGGIASGTTSTVAGYYKGAGGAEGETAVVIINSPAATYTYSIGGAGSAGGAGTSGYSGATGGAGYILVEEFY